MRDLGAASQPRSEAMPGRWESSGCLFEAIVVHPRLRRGAIFGRAGEENGWESAVGNSGAIPSQTLGENVRWLYVFGFRGAFSKDFGAPAWALEVAKAYEGSTISKVFGFRTRLVPPGRAGADFASRVCPRSARKAA